MRKTKHEGGRGFTSKRKMFLAVHVTANSC